MSYGFDLLKGVVDVIEGKCVFGVWYVFCCGFEICNVIEVCW